MSYNREVRPVEGCAHMVAVATKRPTPFTELPPCRGRQQSSHQLLPSPEPPFFSSAKRGGDLTDGVIEMSAEEMFLKNVIELKVTLLFPSLQNHRPEVRMGTETLLVPGSGNCLPVDGKGLCDSWPPRWLVLGRRQKWVPANFAEVNSFPWPFPVPLSPNACQALTRGQALG